MSLPARLLTFFTYTLVAVGPALPSFVCADVPSGEASNQVLIDWSAFADTYYSYNLNNLPTRNRPYTTQPLYNEELALNLGYIDTKVLGDRVRGRLAAQYGSSVLENYAREPELFWRYIQEANAGYKLSEQVWIDAGIFLSHIGLEGWISRDNWTYTRSLIADYSPYYQSGAKVSYQASKELAASVHVLHGWQNISDDRDLALGTQVSYQPNDSTSFVYNTFLGNEQGNRFFNDLIAKRQISKSLSIGTSFDIGFQERKVEQDTVAWHGWALLAQYKVYSALRVAGRVEGYSDPHQVIIMSLSGNHVTATGLSVNVDVDLTTELLWRTEYRVLLSSEDVFPRASGFSDSESMVVTSLAYELGSYSD